MMDFNQITEKAEKTFDGSVRFSVRFFKGLVLMFWIIVLAWFAIIALNGNAPDIIKQMSFEPFGRFRIHMFFTTEPPSVVLNSYLSDYEGDKPPMRELLSQMMVMPPWYERRTDKSDIKADSIKKEKAQDLDNSDFLTLFDGIHEKIMIFVADDTLKLNDVEFSIAIVPTSLRREGDKEVVKMPASMAAWIERERERFIKNEDETLETDKLINTFLMLIVLGSFGSLIFLTRAYINKEREITIATYIFRPLLGQLLAVAMFVIDVMAHAVISSASIHEIRSETLYILAFAAGLLSEQAYELVHHKAEEALKKLKQGSNNQTT